MLMRGALDVEETILACSSHANVNVFCTAIHLFI